MANRSQTSARVAFDRDFIKTRDVPSARTNQPPWIEPAQRLRAAFEESGLSQNKLAKKAGVDPVTFGDMLKGARVPRPDSLRAVCKALGVSTVFIKTGVGEQRGPGEAIAGSAPIVPDGRHAPIPGIESWLANQTGVALDEQQWLRRLQWPEPFILYPDPVYEMALQLYRSMRNYSRSSVIGLSIVKSDPAPR